MHAFIITTSNQTTQQGKKMKIMTKKIKLFGKTETMFQVVDLYGEVLQICCDKEEAESWIASKQ